MDFITFKKRYEEKMQKYGATCPDDEALAELYIGLVIFSEWQADQMAEATEQVKTEAKKEATKTKIILPGVQH